MMIVGDLGGTHARFAFTDFKKIGEFKNLEVLLSRDYDDFISALGTYLKHQGNPKIKRACFAVAGPVIDGVCKVTNLPWVIDSKEIAKVFKIPKVSLINDLEAEAYAICVLPKKSLVSLTKVKHFKEGNRALISPGTGLGEAGLYWDGKIHHPFPCEGGNADFAPRNKLQLEFSEYIMKHYPYPAMECALSGPGLRNIFHFLAKVKNRKVSETVKKAITEEDPSKVITEFALAKKSPICLEALDLFVTFFGQEASNTALKFMALGGIYLGGGIVPKILPKLKEGLFLEAFLNKERFRYLLEQIPIFALDNKFSALFGTTVFAAQI